MTPINAKIELIFNFTSGKLSMTEFLDRYGLLNESVPNEVARLLEEGLERKDANLVEAGNALGFHFSFTDDAKAVVYKLVAEPFHREHEELIGLLQEWRLPSSIPALKSAIDLKPSLTHVYYSDYSYYKKCLWALTAIGTPEAKELIEVYTNSPIPELREEALYRLEKFERCAAWSAATEKERTEMIHSESGRLIRQARAAQKVRFLNFWRRILSLPLLPVDGVGQGEKPS